MYYDLHTGDFNISAHDPYFLRFILDIPREIYPNIAERLNDLGIGVLGMQLAKNLS